MEKEITIPKGFEATIDGNKIILKKIESEDEKILKEIISIVKSYRESCITEGNHRFDNCISWLEKQGNQNHIEQNLEMVEALRTEYEKGRADAIAEMQKEWSDKEKQMYADIIEATKKSGVFKEAYKRELVDWLKSLKDRYTWKPSDDQMRALEYIINNASNTSYSCKIAKGLLEQLKKLKGH